jgi:hypothetical protein
MTTPRSPFCFLAVIIMTMAGDTLHPLFYGIAGLACGYGLWLFDREIQP